MVTGANRPVGMGKSSVSVRMHENVDTFLNRMMRLYFLHLNTAQFKRAVRIATGHHLSENVLDTVFKLFDMDGDSCLSHKEFIGVMNDRVMRGLKVSSSVLFTLLR